MPTIKMIEIESKNVIASGDLGQEVLELEGYYYFPKNQVNMELLEVKPQMYTCPIKNSTCDYYYPKGKTNGREVAWIYPKINNSLFQKIEGMVGFYATSNQALEVELN